MDVQEALKGEKMLFVISTVIVLPYLAYALLLVCTADELVLSSRLLGVLVPDYLG